MPSLQPLVPMQVKASNGAGRSAPNLRSARPSDALPAVATGLCGAYGAPGAVWWRVVQTLFAAPLRWSTTLGWALLVGALVALSGCKEEPAEPPAGKLVIATQTDMSVPGGIDAIQLRVTEGDEIRHDETFALAPKGDTTIPLVVTLDAGADSERQVVVSVIGLRKSEAVVFAQAVTQVPRDRTALLHMPLQYLCVGSAEAAGDFFSSTCPDIDGEPAACVAGECKPVTIKESSLPDYEPRNVFGGAEGPNEGGACFATEDCFSLSQAVEPNEDCEVTVDLPAGKEPNLGLTLPNDQSSLGICGPAGCVIPLNSDEELGFEVRKATTTDGDTHFTLGLPKAVCGQMAEGSVAGVVASGLCETKTSRTPTCGPWSSTDQTLFVAVQPILPGDAGADADTGATTEAGATTELSVQIVPVDGWDGGTLVAGQTVQLVLIGADPDSVVDWQSSDESIATVDEQGLVTIVGGPGTVIIRATVDGIVVEFEITVGETTIEVPWVATVASLMLDPMELTLPAGASSEIVARGTLTDGTTREVTTTVQWESEDEGIVTVVGGRVWAVAPGTTTVRATLNDITARASVTVTDAVLS